ncbi:hypothetical protein DI09_5p200 [Mitosporidium daphniae]|uniref:EF-hand domain-containing protein n=1 Tax=Mitosporidium daphniae TaxID=1485682 RepID=A0A098VNN9_9MICR|nr:uncharacterized protein DI09_5p200 [Mitosporidium daphniae]KGG50673.1 hypothetical protein DI09_5p200 [Mitosporidium daphniae]|eukprot:XP_013237100.1 uncharacterized protein DI09_5p200 [Mitosporidium daphniae]
MKILIGTFLLQLIFAIVMCPQKSRANSESSFGIHNADDSASEDEKFWNLDLNSDGIIDAMEMLTIISWNQPLESDAKKISKMEDILRRADRNKDNAISFLEFEEAPSQVREEILAFGRTLH